MIWCCLFPVCIYGISFFGCAICLVSGIPCKAAMGSPKIIYHILVGTHQAELFSNKSSLSIQFYKLFGLCFYVDFLLNLGFYYNVVKCRYQYLNRQHISKRPILDLYIRYGGVSLRVLMSNVRIKNVGIAGQASFSYRALV